MRLSVASSNKQRIRIFVLYILPDLCQIAKIDNRPHKWLQGQCSSSEYGTKERCCNS